VREGVAATTQVRGVEVGVARREKRRMRDYLKKYYSLNLSKGEKIV
jgi:hypothetical protein